MPPDSIPPSTPIFPITFPGWWFLNESAPTPFLREATLILLGICFAIIFIDFILKTPDPMAKGEGTPLALTTLGAGVIAISYAAFLQARLPLPGVAMHGPLLITCMPIYLLIAILNIHIYRICRRTFWAKSPTGLANARLKPALGFLTLLVIFSVMYTPFIHYRASEEVESLTGIYRAIDVVSEDDYELMLWMKGNLEQDAVVLVNEWEPGTYIPSVSHRKVIFPFIGVQYSHSYQELQGLIQQGQLDARAYQLMEHFEITHIYIGSAFVYGWGGSGWNAQIFLDNPNFRLTKNIGHAYLFEVLYPGSEP